MAAVHALLIGIDAYAPGSGVPLLRGCRADVLALRETLVRRLGVPAAQVRTLLDAEATRDAVEAAWRALCAALQPGDAAFVHFSGHGSLAASDDPAEPHGFDETLVLWDSRTPGGRDLRDKEVGALLDRVAARGAQALLFLDCCHSGGATRAAGATQSGLPAAVRFCPPAARTLPSTARGTAHGTARDTARARHDALRAQAARGRHVVLAACLDEEKAAEYAAPGGWHGAATWFFLKALEQAAPDAAGTLTWAEIYDQVLAGVRTAFPRQTPQLLGPGETLLLGGRGPAAPAGGYLVVLATQGRTRVQVDGGLALGLNEGSRLALAPPGADPASPPLALATVVDAQADTAWAELDEAADIPTAGRARVLAYGYDSPRHGVATDDALLRAWLDGTADGAAGGAATEGRARFVQPAGPADATFAVFVDQGRYQIADAAGDLLLADAAPVGREGAAQVAALLEHLAIVRNVAALRNRAVDPALRGALALSPPLAVKPSRSERIAFGAATALETDGGAPRAHPGDRLGLRVTNQSDSRVFVTVLQIGPDASITRLAPADGRQVTLAAGRTLDLILRAPPLPPARAQGALRLKVFVTRVPVSFDSLLLPPLEARAGGVVPLPDPHAEVRHAGSLAFLLDAVRRTGTRPVRPLQGDSPDDQWYCHDVEITLRA